MSANTDVSMQDFKANATHRELECGSERTGFSLRHLRIFGGLALLALSASLTGQSHYCIGGDIDHLTPATVAACQAKMAGLRMAVKQHGAPADWHFVVVCDDAGWKEYSSFSGRETGMISGAGYSTDPRLHWTFLRGSDLDVEEPGATLQMVNAALESVPSRRSAPVAPASGRSNRQYSIAMTQPADAQIEDR